MEWTEEKENQWAELTKLREENKHRVGVLHTIKVLKDAIQRLEEGKNLPESLEFEYIRDGVFYASNSPNVIGVKITILF